MERNGDWILTRSGKQFWPLDPRPEDVDILDIAHALARQCRFSGHVLCDHYSVAEHSVRVSRILPPEHRLRGLLHDSPEAYLVDLPTPIKRDVRIGDPYRKAEARLMSVICEALGLPDEPEPVCVKEADRILLMTEKRDLMAPSPAPWSETAKPIEERIVPWTRKEAEMRFLMDFRTLTRSAA